MNLNVFDCAWRINSRQTELKNLWEGNRLDQRLGENIVDLETLGLLLHGDDIWGSVGLGIKDYNKDTSPYIPNAFGGSVHRMFPLVGIPFSLMKTPNSVQREYTSRYTSVTI